MTKLEAFKRVVSLNISLCFNISIIIKVGHFDSANTNNSAEEIVLA